VEAGSFISELKRRRVIRALVGYGIAAFAVLQVIEPVMHGLHWPDAVLSYTVAALALGFPVVVGLAWIFDVKEGRIERTAPHEGWKGARLAALLVSVGVLAAAPGVVYFFFLRRAPEARASAAPSIAVLPFVNIGGDKENEYFSDGITEELINALANVDGLRVTSRTAVFALKGRNLDVGQIGAQLKVSTLLEGSVRRDGSTLRITAQLIKVDDGFHLWSKTYDRELKNIFAVEDEIARSIAQALQRTLVRAEGVKPSTPSTEAHDLYLKGRYFWNKRNLEAFRKAAGFFEQAIQEDPGYALAWTGLADAVALRMEYDAVATSEIAPKARAAAQKALEIDPGLAEAHCSLGNILWHEFEWKAGERELRKAIELRPDYATAHQWLAELLSETGRIPEARAEIALALRADPTALIIHVAAGNIELLDRNFEGAREPYRRALEMDPSFEIAHWAAMSSYLSQKRPAEARAELAKIGSWPRVELLGYSGAIDALAGRREDALRTAREIEQLPGNGYVPPAALALIHVALGDKDKAFPLLFKGCSERDNLLQTLRDDPFYDGLRSDPRWAGLLRCMNLE
jgi:serine/threonine-protein kinase